MLPFWQPVWVKLAEEADNWEWRDGNSPTAPPVCEIKNVHVDFFHFLLETYLTREKESQTLYLQSMSAMMSSASSWTETSSCLAIALVRRPVIFLQTLAAKAEPDAREGKKRRVMFRYKRSIC